MVRGGRLLVVSSFLPPCEADFPSRRPGHNTFEGVVCGNVCLVDPAVFFLAGLCNFVGGQACPEN